MNLLAEFYQWEVEHVGGRTIRQYNDDGSENPSTMIVPAKVVRASILPRVPGLPRHDVGLDPDREQRFVRRFGRSFEKHTETNIESILTLYKYRIVDGRARQVHYSIRNGVVEPEGCPLSEVRSIDHLTSIEDALSVMGLTGTSHFDALLNHLRLPSPNKPLEQQPLFYQGLADKYGLACSIEWLLATLSLTPQKRLGDLLEMLGFPKTGKRFEYVHCIETTHYRLWVFSSSGQSLVTNPEYQFYM